MLKLLINVLPTLFILTILIIIIRIIYMVYNDKKVIFYKEIIMFIFVFYILFLYYMVTFKDNNYGVNNFIIFKEILRYNIKSPLFFRNVIGNILLFIPLGLFLTYYKKNSSFFHTFLFSIIVSFFIELIQGMIGITFDIDDIILNLIGSITGFYLFNTTMNLKKKLPNFLKKQLFLDILSFIIILVIIYLIANLYIGGIYLELYRVF